MSDLATLLNEAKNAASLLSAPAGYETGRRELARALSAVFIEHRQLGNGIIMLTNCLLNVVENLPHEVVDCESTEAITKAINAIAVNRHLSTIEALDWADTLENTGLCIRNKRFDVFIDALADLKEKTDDV